MNPCPNPECEGDLEALILERDPLNTMQFYGWVKCDWCGMQGPVGKGEDSAVKHWNALPQTCGSG